MTTVEVTDRQLEIFKFIETFIGEKSYPPTRQEIADAFGFASVNGAEQHLRALEKKGAIRIVPNVSRGIVLVAESSKPKPPPQEYSAMRAA